jgi:hypothetical protein
MRIVDSEVAGFIDQMAGPTIARECFLGVVAKVNDPLPGSRFTLPCMAGQAGLHFLWID